MLNKLKRYLFRRKTPVVFEDTLRVEPVSNFIGTERKTPIDRYYIEQFITNIVANFPRQAHSWTDLYQIPRSLVRNWTLYEFKKQILRFRYL